MPYRLKIAKAVRQDMERLPGNVRQRVKRAIAGLAFELWPANADQFEDELAAFWRIKVEDYRIIYSLDNDVVTVEIIRVAKRTPRTYAGLV